MPFNSSSSLPMKNRSLRDLLFNEPSKRQQQLEEQRICCGTSRWIKELSSLANVVVGQCASILLVEPGELQRHFEEGATESAKHHLKYARNLLEYCCFQALSVATARVPGHLSDKDFGRLTFDMMLAWEAPGASDTPSVKVDVESTVGLSAFARIAPAIPVVADIVTVHRQFEALTSSIGGRLPFPLYDKYLGELDKSMKAMKRLATPALVSSLNLDKEELVIDIDGITITKPVLQHVGISTWPGRLTLTDRGLYFEKVGAVSYDKPKKFDLSVDLKHIIKPDWTGPWGLRLFDKAILYKSDAMQEPISFEFPELRCHARRDYWLNIIREVALAHNFVRKFHLGGAHQTEVQAKAVLGIVRLCATRALVHLLPLRPELLLTFSLANQLPAGDLVLEALADRLCKGELGALVVRDEVDVKHQAGPVIASFSGSNKPLSGAFVSKEEGIPVGEVLVGNLNNLEKAILNSRIYSKKVEVAQTTIEGVKLDDLGKKLAAMKGLLEPLIACGLRLQGIAAWKDPYQTITFLLVSTYIIYRNWLGYVLPTMLALCVGYVLRSRHFRRASKLHEIVVPPPPKQSAIEQLSDLQRTFTQLEGSIQTANITLLKLYTLFINELPEATDQAIWIISGLGVGLAWIPFRIIFLVLFLDFFTRQHNLRRESTERFIQRLREWWHSIPVVPIRFAEPKCKTQ